MNLYLIFLEFKVGDSRKFTVFSFVHSKAINKETVLHNAPATKYISKPR